MSNKFDNLIKQAHAALTEQQQQQQVTPTQAAQATNMHTLSDPVLRAAAQGGDPKAIALLKKAQINSQQIMGAKRRTLDKAAQAAQTFERQQQGLA